MPTFTIAAMVEHLSRFNSADYNFLTRDNAPRLYLPIISDPTMKDSDGDGLDDDLDDYPLDKSKAAFLIYETKENDEYLLSLNGGKDGPNDYRYADKTIDELKNMKWINWTDFIGDHKWIKGYMKMIANDFAIYDMNIIVEEMFDQFFAGIGGIYSNEILNEEARCHEASINYIEKTTALINDYIKQNNGNISGLKYNKQNRNSSIMVNQMSNNKIIPPVYDDKFGGLGICVDATYGNQIEITSFSFDGKNYEYTVKYTIYDIFGLDDDDISNSDRLMEFGMLALFRYWYIFQHYEDYNGKYKPFITYICFEEKVEGTV